MLKYASRPIMHRLQERFERLYGTDKAPRCMERLDMMVGRYRVGLNHRNTARDFNERDILLITYGDMVRSDNGVPLATLDHFLSEQLSEAVSTVHILPFFPYSSDDGFAVIDYRLVDADLGSWRDIAALNRHFSLMVDLVLNHVSSESQWFRDFIGGIAPHRHFFIEVDPETDLSTVVRPRSKPLLNRVVTRNGPSHVWTTFSRDQIDLNFANPDVLFEFLDILFFYISQGARIIRMDAIAYLWKEPGTSCIHLPQTHETVKIFRDVVELVAPDVVILTETNVPHEENISYFGDSDEAHIVYQFTLPPLLLHALLSGSTQYLTRWAAALLPPPPGCAYLNFTASHDGIGVRPLEGILTPKELRQLLNHIKQQGGQISTKRNSDGSDSPYELNITYFDALGTPHDTFMDTQIDRFMCSQTVMLELQGIPAVYFNSLIGAPNNLSGVQDTGRARTINREKWTATQLQSMLDDASSPRSRIFHRYRALLRLRRAHPAFSPRSTQQVIDLGPCIFAVMRRNSDPDEAILCVSNFTDQPQTVHFQQAGKALPHGSHTMDLISRKCRVDKEGRLSLKAYETVWLTRA